MHRRALALDEGLETIACTWLSKIVMCVYVCVVV